MPDELGPLIRELRGRSGLTQEKLAELSEVSVSTIRRIETGKRFAHRLETVARLTAHLSVSAEDSRRLTAVLVDPAAEPALPDPGPATHPEPPHIPASLADVAAELTHEIRRRWQREEDQRRVNDPYPLPVRWRTAPATLTDHAANVQRLGPGATPVELDLDGDLGSIADVYRRIPSGRLVILGPAGSGKSILAIRLLLGLAAAGRGPVPVIFSLSSWDPATPLRDWLVDKLLRDHPDLARIAPDGQPPAAKLLDAAAILPILDGFDEIAQGLRADAHQELNSTLLPLVMTSRNDEYAEAATEKRPLAGAAAIELTGLVVADLLDYLPRTAATPGARGADAIWDNFLAALQDQAGPAQADVLRVLSAPLMVSLARAMYSDTGDRDPAELFKIATFSDRQKLEEHLLAGFLPAVYRRRRREPAADAGPRAWDVERSRRWLGYLAQHLDRLDGGNQDLAWWRVGTVLRRSTRVALVALACAVSVMVSYCLAGLFYPRLPYGQTVLQGIVIGPLAGLVFGIMYGALGEPPEPTRIRLAFSRAGRRADRGGRRLSAGRLGVAALGGTALGAGIGCVITIERVLAGGAASGSDLLRAGLINVLCCALIYGLATCAGSLVMAMLEVTQDVTSAATPIDLLLTNRATACGQALIIAPVVAVTAAFGGALVTALLQPVFGPLTWALAEGLFIGAVSGLAGASCYVLAATAWGQWAILTRVWLPLTGRLPWNVVAFLDDAYRRGVLRQTGAVYQFRHVRLQQHLARAFRTAGSDEPLRPRRGGRR